MNQKRLSNRGSIHAGKKMKQFLIQFKGKPAEDATWEEQLSISNLPSGKGCIYSRFNDTIQDFVGLEGEPVI